MSIDAWLMYLLLVFIATSTPGPAVVYIVTNSMLCGWQKSVFAAIGNIVGLLCLGIISVTGLGTILATSQEVFTIVKYAGAAYLIYVGIKMIFQNNSEFDIKDTRLGLSNMATHKIFFKSLSIALSNPKAIVFLTALFPQFINTQYSLIPQFSALIIVLMLFSFTFLMIYALLAHQAKNWLSKSSRVKAVNRAGGSIFVGFGILLAASSNR